MDFVCVSIEPHSTEKPVPCKKELSSGTKVLMHLKNQSLALLALKKLGLLNSVNKLFDVHLCVCTCMSVCISPKNILFYFYNQNESKSHLSN